MKSPSHPHPTSLRTLQRGLWLAIVLLVGLLILARPAQAQTAASKVAQDLQDVVAAPTTPKLSWAKDVNGVRYVKVLVVGISSDPDLTDLRSAVLQAGGSVYLRYVSVRALSAMLPAGQVYALAARPDVQSLSPNRLTARTASVLEAATGALNLRRYSGSAYTGLDGRGVGIAVVDSGIGWSHKNFVDDDGKTSRIRRAVDFQKVGDAVAVGVKDWTPGVDASASLYPGSETMVNYEKAIAADRTDRSDRYGHGTHVASVAAGRGAYQATDSSGIAPGADLYDVKVLDNAGYGQLSDVLAGIEWVMYHAKEYNIRVMNLSLAADSTETWLTDPLCRAVRSAVAAGITVVVAAGNYGLDANGRETYGTVSAPGNEPSVITVGSVNTKGNAVRGDDSVNFFSSRGPTRGSYVDPNGETHNDNVLKPDLVAPGNRIVGALGSDKSGAGGSWNYLAKTYAALSSPYGTSGQQKSKQQLFNLSGTSIAAPAVAGTVALMLQTNPGLTPPLIKAILQYSAQPIAGANLLQQGAGLLNVDGAVTLSQALRTDLASAIDAGTIRAGANLLASGKSLPEASSTLSGQTFAWSRIVFAGGRHLVSGDALFTRYQPFYDPRLAWVGSVVRRRTVSYWPGAGEVPGNTYVRSVVEAPAAGQVLVTAGVVLATDLVGQSSHAGATGAFLPTATVSGWLASGSGLVMSEGVFMSEGLVMSEGLMMSEGLCMSEGVFMSEGLMMSEGLLMSEGLMMSEGLLMSESGQTGVVAPDDSSLLGEP
jgi:subtilisin family serine protease